MKIIYDVFREQQRMQNDGSYRFKREFAAWYGDCVANDGLGLPTRKIGLIHSTFRPSDDACLFPLLIPSNFFATVSLRQLAEMAEAELNNPAFASAVVPLPMNLSILWSNTQSESICTMDPAMHLKPMATAIITLWTMAIYPH